MTPSCFRNSSSFCKEKLLWMHNMKPMCSLHTVSFLNAATNHTQNMTIRPMAAFYQAKAFQNRMKTSNFSSSVPQALSIWRRHLTMTVVQEREVLHLSTYLNEFPLILQPVAFAQVPSPSFWPCRSPPRNATATQGENIVIKGVTGKYSMQF